MTDQQLPPALASDERFVWLNELLNENLQGLDLNAMLVYLVDLVKPSVLPILAEQFSMLEEATWPVARSDDDRRALIKTAIELHRYKGTPWAVKQALATIGYPVLELIEQKTYQAEWVAAGGKTLDGTWLLDGSVSLTPPETGINGQVMKRMALNHWAQYAIRLNASEGDWSREQQKRIRKVAEAYAPTRDELVGIIIALQAKFDSRITLKSMAARLRLKYTKCQRFQPAARRTLDGCWKLSGGYADVLLDGGWSLDGRSLNGRSPIGTVLDNSHINTRQKISLRAAMTMGASRAAEPVVLGDRFRSLDGRWQLDTQTLQGWSMDEGRSLTDAQLNRIGLQRLDGTWLLGGELGGPGIQFSATMRIKHNGITTQESL
ncbi:Bacteriophage P2-related tail formation protein [Pseudomonas putida]|nr:Bacteriophage P2-related tail formation protein [Pseudomonas putida]CAB5542208.1 Bacteriophage P2-related tail formation protein [Pseudomonas putida]CAB5543577.1 Bacteriophage P2-related tail formation protein [Pseudomonas putida]CAB5637976.1 Bacteriophage P2-related tail formation protein [Pseudomonas putida]CAB5654002.1 Bacteriophage P2-related tail formation protein [Pseudomonas putida]